MAIFEDSDSSFWTKGVGWKGLEGHSRDGQEICGDGSKKRMHNRNETGMVTSLLSRRSPTFEVGPGLNGSRGNLGN